jgi:hypothetical protein
LKEGQSYFTYAATNNVTNLKVSADTELTFTFDFRDWKYLSQIERFAVDITDPEVIAGNKEGEFQVDFNKMKERDANNGTKFEVGGRMFFEAHVFGLSTTSFTTNGFLDQEGYVEPRIVKTAASAIKANLAWLIPVILLFLASLYFFYRGHQMKKQIAEHDKKMLEKRKQTKLQQGQ